MKSNKKTAFIFPAFKQLILFWLNGSCRWISSLSCALWFHLANFLTIGTQSSSIPSCMQQSQACVELPLYEMMQCRSTQCDKKQCIGSTSKAYSLPSQYEKVNRVIRYPAHVVFPMVCFMQLLILGPHSGEIYAISHFNSGENSWMT